MSNYYAEKIGERLFDIRNSDEFLEYADVHKMNYTSANPGASSLEDVMHDLTHTHRDEYHEVVWSAACHGYIAALERVSDTDLYRQKMFSGAAWGGQIDTLDLLVKRFGEASLRRASARQ
jgi:hypothetical protein